MPNLKALEILGATDISIHAINRELKLGRARFLSIRELTLEAPLLRKLMEIIRNCPNVESITVGVGYPLWYHDLGVIQGEAQRGLKRITGVHSGDILCSKLRVMSKMFAH